jgi:hypothetical protein
MSFVMSGCAATNGEFRDDGFVHTSLPIVVRYDGHLSEHFVGPEWRVDNYVVKEDGSVGGPKTAPGYVGETEVDFEGTGEPEKISEPIYHLKLVNRVTNAAIWVQTVTLAMQDKDRSLRSFLDSFIERLSGSGVYRIVSFNPKQVGGIKTYGARVVDTKEGKLGSFDDLDVTIELVNLDQQKVDPNAKSAIGRVVFVRTDYPIRVTQGHDKFWDARMMVVVGCESSPRDFDATNADFAKFLGAVELGTLSQPATISR